MFNWVQVFISVIKALYSRKNGQISKQSELRTRVGPFDVLCNAQCNTIMGGGGGGGGAEVIFYGAYQFLLLFLCHILKQCRCFNKQKDYNIFLFVFK